MSLRDDAVVAPIGAAGRAHLTSRLGTEQALGPMRLLRTLFRSGRTLAALLLLTAFTAGGAADVRHHLSEQGCAADRGGSDRCICASLHAAPFASEAITQVTPIVCEREFTPAAEALEPVVRAAHAATPRAPPRG